MGMYANDEARIVRLDKSLLRQTMLRLLRASLTAEEIYPKCFLVSLPSAYRNVMLAQQR